MRRLSLFVALVAGAMSAIGCGMQPGQQKASSSSGGIAVLDLDSLAKAVGRTSEIQSVLKSQEAGLNQQLAKAVTQMNQQVTEKKKEHSDPPTEEQQKEIATMLRNGNAVAQENKRRATIALQGAQQQLIAQFRNEIKPLAQEVAASKGLSVVIPKNEGFLLSVDPGVDITADVLKAYQTRKPAPTAAVAPRQPVKAPTTAPEADMTAEAPSETEQQ
jgi:Skp family chaperone for outer membrane proteins